MTNKKRISMILSSSLSIAVFLIVLSLSIFINDEITLGGVLLSLGDTILAFTVCIFLLFFGK